MPGAVEEEGNVAVTGGQLRVVLSVEQLEEVACTVQEPQPS